MSLSSEELAHICLLLNQQMSGGAVQKIHQPQEAVFVVESYGGHCGRARLHIDVSPGSPLIYLATKKLKNPDSPTSLCSLMRTHLSNARIRGIEALRGDRVCFIRFEKMTAKGPRERRLIVELLPGYPVLFLTDEKGVILGATQSVRNQHRDLSRGALYVAPPKSDYKEKNHELFAACPGWTDESIFAFLEEEAAPKREVIDTAFLAKEVNRALKRQRKKITKIEIDLRRLEEQEIGGDYGELLKSALGQVKTGMTEVRVRDWGQEGEVWQTIPLDPALSPQANLERLFQKSKKATRGQEAAKERLGEQRQVLRSLLHFEEKLRAKESNLDALAVEAKELGLKVETKQGQPHKKKIVQARRRPYRTYRSHDGIEILVGRSSQDNDEVTFKHCKGNEWWFHADGYAGSHVVAKTKDDLPQETLLDAATLAVEYSKANSGGKQAVSYTRRKNVSKYKGAKAGQVILSTHKTIMVRFEADRLERLKKSTSDSKP